MKLSGYICVRNAIELDYCVVEAAKSLLPVVDELIICDGESTDGTRELFRDIDPKIKIVMYKWPNPENDASFWTRWLNYARGWCQHPMQITLDADEVLDPAGYSTIYQIAGKGGCAFFRRLNFWKDAKHLAPENTVCGTMVARMGPTELYMPSDEPFPRESPNVRTHARRYPDLKIFHYGFLRRDAAFKEKSLQVQKMFVGACDRRILEQIEKQEKWNERDYFNGQPLQSFDGQHPDIGRAWLTERGYSL